MSRVAYVNGRYVPHRNAMVHVEDRGYQLGDGIYEVIEIFDGSMIDETRHLARMHRSLNALSISAPMSDAALKYVLRETVRRNRVNYGGLYLQITRGAARREHVFPDPQPMPALVVIARSTDPRRNDAAATIGARVITMPDLRWARVDIKTIGLLPNVLAKQAAKQAGAREAWLVDQSGFVTEGGSTNAWIVTPDGQLVTRPADYGILRGVTRTTVMDLAAELGLSITERPFTVAEAKAAREAFMTAATTMVMPVVFIDDVPVGDGRPGPLALKLRGKFHQFAETSGR